MGLKKVPRKPTRNEVIEEMYHNCRWCHYFNSGKCYCKDVQFDVEVDSEILHRADMGEFSEVIEETMSQQGKAYKSFQLGLVDQLKEWKVSNSRQSQFMKIFEEWYNEYVQDMKDELDSVILRKIDNIVSGAEEEAFDGVEILNPESFSCQYFC